MLERFTLKCGTALLAFTFIASGCGLLNAQKPRETASFEILPQNEYPEVRFIQDRSYDIRTGHVQGWHGLNITPAGETAEEKALNFIRANAAQFGVTDADEELELKALRDAKSGYNVRFRQLHQGIPVHNAEIVITLNEAGAVTHVASSFRSIENSPATVATVDAASAKSGLMSYVGLSGRMIFESQELILWEELGDARLAWRFLLQYDDPVGEWEGVIDAVTGDKIVVRDRAFYYHKHKECAEESTETDEYPSCDPMPLAPPPATGSGYVYDADPLSSAGVAYGGSYVDGGGPGDATNAALEAELKSVPLLDLTFSGGNYQLNGPYAAIGDFENPSRGLFSQASSTFNFNRNDNGFEAVNTYYFIDMSMRYLNDTLGVTVMPFQYSGGVQYDPHGLNGQDNSHYMGGTGRVAFGEGCVDDAEDSDVILHELGHGLHDWITSGGLSNNQGLSEGTGDYWTQSYSRSLAQWTTGDAAYHWVFNWDGHNTCWGGRITNYGATYPGGLTGWIHTDGQIWSTCMMQVYDAIGRTKTDVALWEGLAMTNGSASQQDAAIAVRQAAINLGYSWSDLNTMTTILNGCGYSIGPLLPVDLLDFSGIRVDDRRAELSWTTGEEIANGGWDIERRREGEEEFAVIGYVAGELDSKSEKHYSFTDNRAGSGRVWYRLRQVDIDGTEQYSQVVEIAPGEGSWGLVIAPHPVEGALRGSFEAPEATTLTWHVTDLSGRTLLDGKLDVQAGLQDFVLDGTAELPAGAYLLRFDGEARPMSRMFTINR